MRIIFLIIIVALTGCATTQTHEQLAQNANSTLTTYVGGVIFKIQRTSDLPNVFGKADIFGGKVNRGYTALYYQGIASDGQLLFRIVNEDTISNESTMSRYGVSTTTLNAQQYGNSVYGTINTYHPPQGSTQELMPNVSDFSISSSKTSFSVANVSIQIISASKTSFTYILSR